MRIALHNLIFLPRRFFDKKQPPSDVPKANYSSTMTQIVNKAEPLTEIVYVESGFTFNTQQQLTASYVNPQPPTETNGNTQTATVTNGNLQNLADSYGIPQPPTHKVVNGKPPAATDNNPRPLNLHDRGENR